MARHRPKLPRQLAAAVVDRQPGYVHWRLGYGTFVSVHDRFMYMETPKNACSTTKMLLWKLAGLPDDTLTPARSHERRPGEGRPSVMDLEPATARRILVGDRFYRFCFLRDPVARLASAFKDKVRDEGKSRFQGVRDALVAEHGLAGAGDITFDMFASYAAQQPNGDRDAHWQLQTRLNLMSLIDYHFVGRVEEYSRDMRTVIGHIGGPPELMELAGVVHNASAPGDLALSPAVRREVEAAYARDYEAIGRVAGP